MTTVRTQRLLAYVFTVAGQNSPTWTTPAGYTVIVKSIFAYNVSGVQADVYLNASVPGSLLMQIVHLTPTQAQSLEHELYLVLNPGDIFYVQASQSNVVVWVSGSVLSGPPTLPPATRDLVAALPAGGWPREPLPASPIVQVSPP